MLFSLCLWRYALLLFMLLMLFSLCLGWWPIMLLMLFSPLSWEVCYLVFNAVCAINALRCAILLFMVSMLLMHFLLWLERCAILLLIFMLFSLCLEWCAIMLLMLSKHFHCFGRCAIKANYAIFTLSWEVCYFIIYAIFHFVFRGVLFR